MRNRMVSASLVLAGSAAVHLALCILDPTLAAAGVQWMQDVSIADGDFIGPAGCATDIAVDFSGTPWVLGCGGPDPVNRSAFVLQLVCNNCLGGIAKAFEWVNADQGGDAENSAGVRIAVDPVGTPWLVRNNGHISYLLAGSFADMTALATPFGDPSFGVGRLSGIAVMFDTASSGYDVWGLGFPNPGNTSVWQFDNWFEDQPQDPPTAWTQVDAQDSAAGSKIVTFNGTIFGQSYATPILLTSTGSLWSYAPSTGRFSQVQGPPIVDITDHFAIGVVNGALALLQWGDLSGWSNAGTLTTPLGTTIVRIATSFQSGTTSNTLWGVDFNGNIFFSTAQVSAHL